jgi:hypothetical protein
MGGPFGGWIPNVASVTYDGKAQETDDLHKVAL